MHIQESEIRGYRLCRYDEALDFITHGNDRAVFVDAVKALERLESRNIHS